MKKILLSLVLFLILITPASPDTKGTNYTLRSSLKKNLKITGSFPMQGDLDMNSYDINNAGNVDFDTITTDSITVSLLTATRVIFAGIDGLLSDDPDLTFILDTLYAKNLTSTGTITSSGRIVSTTRITGNTTLDATHHQVFCDTDGGSFTVTLPPSPIDGQTYRITNTGSSGNDLTIARNGNLLTGGTDDRTISDSTVIIITFETTEGWW